MRGIFKLNHLIHDKYFLKEIYLTRKNQLHEIQIFEIKGQGTREKPNLKEKKNLIVFLKRQLVQNIINNIRFTYVNQR